MGPEGGGWGGEEPHGHHPSDRLDFRWLLRSGKGAVRMGGVVVTAEGLGLARVAHRGRLRGRRRVTLVVHVHAHFVHALLQNRPLF